MSMTQIEVAVLESIIARLESPNCGCQHHTPNPQIAAAVEAAAKVDQKLELVSRAYLDSWVVPALRALLPGPERNPKLAYQLCRFIRPGVRL